MGAFPSGQRGQTVNLLSVTSVVRIHPLPPHNDCNFDKKLQSLFFAYFQGFSAFSYISEAATEHF